MSGSFSVSNIVSAATHNEVRLEERSCIFDIYTAVELDVTYDPLYGNPSLKNDMTIPLPPAPQRIDLCYKNGVAVHETEFMREEGRTTASCLEYRWQVTPPSNVAISSELNVSARMVGDVFRIRRFKGPRVPDSIRNFFCSICCCC